MELAADIFMSLSQARLLNQPKLSSWELAELLGERATRTGQALREGLEATRSLQTLGRWVALLVAGQARVELLCKLQTTAALQAARGALAAAVFRPH